MLGVRILAVDTTTAFGSIGLLDGDTLSAIFGVGPQPHHAENLLSMVDQILERLGWTLTDLGGLAVASGPGSFTGLKIGVASMEGLALARDLPLVGVGSLLATAWPHRHSPGLVASVIQAYRGEIYGALYEKGADSQRLEPRMEPVCEPPERFAERLGGSFRMPLLLAGTGVERYRETWKSLDAQDVRFAPASYFLAEAVARLGVEAITRGERGVDVMYVRASEAERNRESNR